jgi:hypothetical protein
MARVICTSAMGPTRLAAAQPSNIRPARKAGGHLRERKGIFSRNRPLAFFKSMVSF